jgi:hypothetical protein
MFFKTKESGKNVEFRVVKLGIFFADSNNV